MPKIKINVVLNQYFKGYWNNRNYVPTINGMWKKKTRRKADQMEEVNWHGPERHKFILMRD